MTVPAPRPLRIAVFSCDRRELACPQVRFESFARTLDEDVELLWATRTDGNDLQVDLSVLEQVDAVAVARFFPQEATWPFIERILASGRPVVYELDDLLTEIPAANPFHDTAARIRPYVTELLARATAVTTSTAVLAEELRAFSGNVHVVPNCIDAELFFSPARRREEELLVAFAGTDTHAHDLAAIADGLARAADRLGSAVRFLFFGCTTERAAGIPAAAFLPFEARYVDYASALRGVGIGLALGPLVDDRFNRAKSPIKFLEFAAAGVPGLWSDLAPYRDAVRDGETGLLLPLDPDAWCEAICALARDEDRRFDLAQRAQRSVLEAHAARVGARRFLEVYRRLCAPRTALPAAPASALQLRVREQPLRSSLIVPVWNRVDLTSQCLERLVATTDPDRAEILVIDNGSSDETPSLLRSYAGRVRALHSESNLGFGGGCNEAARSARGELLVFLNNDTLALPGWLDALEHAVDQDAGAGIVGSRLLFPDGTIQHAGVAIARRTLAPYLFWRGVAADAPMVSRRRELQAVTGASMLVRASLFRALGGFDPGYRNGFEDVDLCLRAGERGWRVLYEPASTLHHLESQTPGRRAHDAANLERFLARWGHPHRADEDRIYFEDGFHIRVELEDDAPVLRYLPFADDAERARWEIVAQVQTRASRRGPSAARELLCAPSPWPDDPDLRAWAASLCEEAGLDERAAWFRGLPAPAPQRPPAPDADDPRRMHEPRGSRDALAGLLRQAIDAQLQLAAR
jgi:GT2 family glycosyltransferase/glycosyltransferase involved in cell wall biosynthesis